MQGEDAVGHLHLKAIQLIDLVIFQSAELVEKFRLQLLFDEVADSDGLAGPRHLALSVAAVPQLGKKLLLLGIRHIICFEGGLWLRRLEHFGLLPFDTFIRRVEHLLPPLDA